jgi:acetate---CoA ligase (ADP-forming)
MSRPLTSRPDRSLADNVLRPRRVAIVGASDDETKAAARPLRFLRQSGFGGAVYPINPNRTQVQGEPTWPSLRDLPEVPDHVYVLTNADAAISAVAECGELGVPIATVLANGFADKGTDGEFRQRRLLDVARQGGVRILGPNSLGVVNVQTGLVLTGNAAFAEPEMLAGDVLLASQSGSAIGAYLSRGHAHGLGFAAMVSFGGEADISVGELCADTLDDPGVRGYALFLEAVQHIEALAAFGLAAHRRGKPVTVFKVGRSDQAAALTVTHTGAIAGAYDESRAFLRACGFTLVDNFESLIETPALAARLPRVSDQREPRIAVLTSTGGGAAIVVDELAARGCTVTQPSASTFAELVAAGCPVAASLVVDLTLAGTTHELVRQAVRILQRSAEFDLILFVLGSSPRFNPELAVSALVECAAGETPLAAFALPDAPQAMATLHAAGIATFRTPESCAAGIHGVFSRRQPTVRTAHLTAGVDTGAGAVLDESASAAVLKRQQIAVVPSVVIEAADAVGAIELPFEYPVVVKALSARLPHKLDAGAVQLDVAGHDELRQAMARIRLAVGAYDPTIRVTAFLVQPMLSPGVADVLIGYRVSPTVGPIVMLAVGGVLAELYKDSTIRLAPVQPEDAASMVDDVLGLQVLHGFRGKEPGDVEGLVAAITAMSRLIEDQPDVLEAEINPLRVGAAGSGVVALDALVRVRGTRARSIDD